MMRMIEMIDRSLVVSGTWYCSWGATPEADDIVADIVLLVRELSTLQHIPSNESVPSTEGEMLQTTV